MIRDKDGLTGADAFDEFIKLIFVKMHEEKLKKEAEVSLVRKELPSIIRKEVSPIVEKSEAKIISEFTAGFEKYHHELLQELKALTSA